MELIWIIVGLGITIDISGYQFIESLIILSSLSHRNCDRVGIKAKMIFRRICYPISLLYFSIILSSRRSIKMDIFLNSTRSQGMYVLEPVEKTYMLRFKLKTIVSRDVIWLFMNDTNDNFQLS